MEFLAANAALLRTVNFAPFQMFFPSLLSDSDVP